MTIKKIILNTYSALNADRLFINHQPRVLFYHGVDRAIKNANIETESISAADFERQLKYITRYFKPISLPEFYRRYSAQSWQGGEILLTFDDGYKNLLTDGLPLLEKYKTPFALFITTNNITNGTLFPTTINRLVNLAHKNDPQETERTSRIIKSAPIETVNSLCDELLSQISKKQLDELRQKYSSINPMTCDEVLKISQSSLCTIGSHCVTHICCHDKQKSKEIQRQLSQSKNDIEAHLGIKCEFLAWPNGNFTPEAEGIAQSCGYKMAFSTRYRAVEAGSEFSVGRIQVPYDYARFKYVISRFPG